MNEEDKAIVAAYEAAREAFESARDAYTYDFYGTARADYEAVSETYIAAMRAMKKRGEEVNKEENYKAIKAAYEAARDAYEAADEAYDAAAEAYKTCASALDAFEMANDALEAASEALKEGEKK